MLPSGQKAIQREHFICQAGLVSGDLEVSVSASIPDAQLQYVAIFDVCEGRTNQLGSAWGSPVSPSFVADTTRLKNWVRHKLFATLVHKFGDTNWSDGVRIVSTEPVTVTPHNPVSLNGIGDTERIFLSFTPAAAHSTWSVEVNDGDGNHRWDWSDRIEDSLANVEIVVGDEERLSDFEGYDPNVYRSFFSVPVKITPEGGSPVTILPMRESLPTTGSAETFPCSSLPGGYARDQTSKSKFLSVSPTLSACSRDLRARLCVSEPVNRSKSRRR